MRLTLITFGTEGDCRPMIALGLGLQRAGHSVVLLGERATMSAAKEYGLPFEPLAGDIQATLQPGGVLHKLITTGDNPVKATQAFARIAQDNTVSWMSQLRDCARNHDAIVFSGLTAYVALSVGEYLGIPVIAAGLWPISPTTEFPSPLMQIPHLPGWANRATHQLIHRMLWHRFRPALNDARHRVCHQPARQKMWEDKLVIYGMSPHLVPRPHDWQEDWQVTGVWMLPVQTDWQPPFALQTFLNSDEAPLYVGFGSMTGFNRQKTLQTLVEAIDGRRTLLYPGQSGIDLSVLPPNFHVIPPTPHQWLFQHVHTVIHHGGAGTTHAAATAGVPSIVLPVAGDQMFWANRLAALGVAPKHPRNEKYIRPRQLSKMIAFTDQSEVRVRARELGRQIRAETGVENAVAYIENKITADS